MNKLEKIIASANQKVNDAEDMVTRAVQRILIDGGIPKHVAEKYCATRTSCGEWLLDDENRELSRFDIQVGSCGYDIVRIVKDVEENGYEKLI